MCHSGKQRSCITPCFLRFPCFKHSRILVFYFSSSLSSWRTIGPWSLGIEHAHLLLPQDHPRDSLTHHGGQSPSGCVALGPETAANSPLLLFTLLTLPFCIHGSQQRPKTAQSRVPESLILDRSSPLTCSVGAELTQAAHILYTAQSAVLLTHRCRLGCGCCEGCWGQLNPVDAQKFCLAR